LHECETGLKIVQKKHPNVKSLRDVSFEILIESKANIDSVIYNRCEYILEENKRVIEASEALKNNDLAQFGTLMYGSHDGLQHKYQVSCPELDFLVEFSRDKAAILGSRMMGGGFGGCTLNLIHKDAIETYTKQVSEAYQEEFNIKLDAYIAMPDKGTTIKTC
jgi:galactokinase